jgi:hypothetical protein
VERKGRNDWLGLASEFQDDISKRCDSSISVLISRVEFHQHHFARSQLIEHMIWVQYFEVSFASGRMSALSP